MLLATGTILGGVESTRRVHDLFWELLQTRFGKRVARWTRTYGVGSYCMVKFSVAVFPVVTFTVLLLVEYRMRSQ